MAHLMFLLVHTLPTWIQLREEQWWVTSSKQQAVPALIACYTCLSPAGPPPSLLHRVRNYLESPHLGKDFRPETVKIRFT